MEIAKRYWVHIIKIKENNGYFEPKIGQLFTVNDIVFENDADASLFLLKIS